MRYTLGNFSDEETTLLIAVTYCNTCFTLDTCTVQKICYWQYSREVNSEIRGSCKKFCHWVQITSVLRFIKHIFITTLQNIPPLLEHIFVTFLPSREKQINSLLWYLLETLINGPAKRTSRRILISRKHFLKPWK